MTILLTIIALLPATYSTALALFLPRALWKDLKKQDRRTFLRTGKPVKRFGITTSKKKTQGGDDYWRVS